MYTLITGATSDIGQTIAKVLAREGKQLLLMDVSANKLSELVNSLPDIGHIYCELDFTDAERVKDIVTDFITQKQIVIENAIFAAGIFTISPLRLIDYDIIKKSFDIGLFSSISIIQTLTTKKINGQNLRGIVFISSVSAKLGTKGYAIYGAVKASILGLMKSLAAELAPNTRVNAILPGGIRTRATEFIYATQTEINPRYILGEGNPSNIADIVSFLLSEKSAWMTGQEVIVDGGYTII